MPSTDPTLAESHIHAHTSLGRQDAVSRPPGRGPDRLPVAVGPGPVAVDAPIAFAVDAPIAFPVMRSADGSGYPIQQGKVQPPPVRDQILARDRLLDWLEAKIHHRAVLVIAEAGYGKTTLLADFSRRSRIRTLWYRLDEDDQSWVSFLDHLVAAGREHDPTFAPRTAALLAETGISGATRDDVLEVFLRELRQLDTTAAALILDDYHLVDEAPDVRVIMRRLIAQAPDRLTIVIASRRHPNLPLARLRAQGEVVELSADDLRFDASETERLFRETFGRPLEPDVLADLGRRTEGWAASLQLVQAALRDRTSAEIRTFVRNLSGAHGDLHDYLAEEVVGELPEETQKFAMRAAVLQAVLPDLASLVTGTTAAEAREQLAALERCGLLSRSVRSGRGGLRYHPLVREFLLHRLRHEEGDASVQKLNRDVALWASGRDWRLACHHLIEAGEPSRVAGVLEEMAVAIMGSGGIEQADAYIQQSGLTPAGALAVVSSRASFRRGDVTRAVALAHRALEEGPGSDLAVSNYAAVRFLSGELDGVGELARMIEERSDDPVLRAIATATVSTIETSLDGNLEKHLLQLRSLAGVHHALGYLHFEGISLLNLATGLRPFGDPDGALESADRAIAALEASSRGTEVSAARQVRAWALAHLGDLGGARAELGRAQEVPHGPARIEALIESAMIETWYGSEETAAASLRVARDLGSLPPDLLDMWRVASAELALRQRRAAAAKELLEGLPLGHISPEPAHQAREMAVLAHVAALAEDPSFSQLAEEARIHATRQSARLWADYCSLLAALTTIAPATRVASLPAIPPVFKSILAELVVPHLHQLDDDALASVRTEAELRPERWRPSLRHELEKSDAEAQPLAAALLDVVGTADDVSRLRRLARTNRSPLLDRRLGKNLAVRLAPVVIVEDLGRVTLRVGDRHVPGTEIRRKVLALLCLLISRPGFAATRDQVIDVLWPDLDPDVAVNSLNQTVYFLRRVFEPMYSEDTSADYVHHDSDVLWLDRALVRSESAECLALIHSLGLSPSPASVARLSDAYHGKFALDFSYEDWAVSYREALHAAYLQVVEAAVTADIAAGQFGRAISLLRGALQVDSDAEHLELTLLRLYRQTGAHAAAAEQYAHYASAYRSELGVDPPPLDELLAER